MPTAVPTPLLDTKFHVATPRRDLVPRPRLDALVRRGVDSRLTLISAPAGFGKTTLAAEWVGSSGADGRVTAWLSLDATDDEPRAFWAYVATALSRALPSVERARSMLDGPDPPPIDVVVTELLNELAAVDDDVVLVLDDYHVIAAPDVHDGVVRLLDHLPPRVHLVVVTRADPPLPLARLRARGELVEIRAADLRFTTEEAAAYLRDTVGRALEPIQVEALEERTEGWIAALQLAAISMRDRDDVDAFIAGFTGDDRFVVDYLVEEVLARQADDVRTFLLETSILDRLTGDLCNAVTGREGGSQTLESLERSNLFVIPLDARREWYRYHHLFADVLRSRLALERPDRTGELHRRASRWYEQHGDRSEAIRHALAGRDFERAADLMEPVMAELRQTRQETTLRRLLEALPDDVLRRRPVLNVAYVGALMTNGELADVEGRLQDAERLLDGPDAQMVVVDRTELARLPAAIAMYRAAQAQIAGDLEGSEAQARRALELASEDDPLAKGGAAGFLALTHWTRGDLEAAHGFWSEAATSLDRAGHAVDVIGCTRPLAEIRFAQGRLGDALQTYERGLQLAMGPSGPMRGAADLHVGMSELFLEWDDLDAAADHLRQSQDLGQPAGLPQNAHRWRVAMALLRQAEGDADAADDLLREAERLYVSEFYPPTRPIAAIAARIHATQGRISEARAWARERGLSTADELSSVREYEHITLARVLMAQARLANDKEPMREAAAFLERLLDAAEAGGRGRSLVELLVLQAMAINDLGTAAAALGSLERALALAEREGFVRTFVAEGAPMAALLTMAAAHGVSPDYVRRLQEASTGDARVSAGNRRLDEPLSERELEVLRLLASDLNGPDIARELVVGLSTVRSHTKSIYAKLGVTSRRAAVRRGEELGLLARTSVR